MKRNLFSLVVASLLVAVLGLGAMAAEPVQLEVVVANAFMADWLQSNLSAFNAKNGYDVTLNIKQIWSAPYVEHLTLVASTNLPYDLVQVNPGRNYHYFAKNGLFRELDSFIARDGFDTGQIYAPTYDDAVVNGNTYALAYGTHPGHAGVFYNEEYLSQAGLAPPDADWSFDDWVRYAVRLTKKDSGTSEPKVYGLQLPRYHGFSPAFNGQLVNAEHTKAVPNPQGVLNAIEWLVDLKGRDAMMPFGGNPILDGRAAMGLNGPWFSRNVNQSDIGDHWNVASIPTGPAGRISGGAAWDGFAIPRTAKHPEIAWKFMQFMLSDGPLTEFSGMGGNPAANIKVNLKPELMSLTGRPVFVEALASGNFVFDPPQEIASLYQKYIGGASFGPVLNGEMSPAAAVETMAAEAEAILARLNREN